MEHLLGIGSCGVPLILDGSLEVWLSPVKPSKRCRTTRADQGFGIWMGRGGPRVGGIKLEARELIKKLQY